MNIKCSHKKVVPIDTLKPHPKNPNKHPAKQIELLARIIDQTGWRAPVVVSNRSGYITKGHGRLEAARLLKLPVVPVDYQDYASDDEEIADMLADNKIASYAELPDDEVKTLLEAFQPDFDKSLAGFDDLEFARIMQKFDEKGENNVEDEYQDMPDFVQEKLAFKTLKVHFANESDVQTFANLLSQKVTKKTRYIWYPMQERKDATKCTVKDES